MRKLNKTKCLKLLFFSYLATGLSLQAIAGVNLLKADNGVYKKIPVYDQGSLNNCYSFAAINLFDYQRAKRGLIKDNTDLTSTLWASVLFKDKTLLGQLMEYTGISFDKKSPLDSGDAISTLTALRKYGSCTRKSMQNILYQKYPELTYADKLINIEEFTGIIHYAEQQWNKFYQKALNILNQKEEMPLIDEDFVFPSAGVGLSARGKWKDKKSKPLDYNWDKVKHPQFYDHTVKQDNTYVAMPNIHHLEDLQFDDNEQPSQTVTSTPSHHYSNDDNHQDQDGDSQLEDNIDPSRFFTEFKPQTFQVKQDNTFVHPDYSGQTAAKHNMARYYATEMVLTGLKNKYGVNFSFVKKILSQLRGENGYWDLVKNIIEPCFDKAEKTNMGRVHSGLPLNESLFIRATQNLINHRQPIAIEYCSELLYDGEVHSMLSVSGECGSHLSVIVGYRQHYGRHQVLIQNSWGKSCGSYSDKWECHKEQGAVWVDSSTLYKSSFRMVWYK